MQTNMNVPPVVSTYPPPPPPPPVAELPYATPTEFTHPPDWTNVEVFTLDPAQRNRFLALLLFLSCLITAFILAAALLIKYLMLSAIDPVESVIFITLFGIFQFVTMLRLFLRHRRSWPTYRFLVSDQGFILSSLVTPRTRVDAINIRRITETLDTFKVFLPVGRHVSVSKRIPPADLARLRDRLHALHPIAPGRGLLGLVSEISFTWGLALASISLFYVGMLSSNPRVVLLCTLTALLITLIRIWRQSRNKLLRLTTRILMFVDLLFPLLLTLKYMALRLFP
jgi:hypothetical protein